MLFRSRARVQIGRLSRFGLLELSRQRLRPSLSEANSDICPRCKGTGHVRSVLSISLNILRLIQDEAMKENTAAVQVHLPVDAATYLLNEKRHEISSIESKLGTPIIVVPTPELQTPHYTIQRLKIEEYEEQIDTASHELSYADSEEAKEAKEKEAAETRPVTETAAVAQLTHASAAPQKAKAKGESFSIVAFLKKLFGLDGRKKPKQTRTGSRRPGGGQRRRGGQNRQRDSQRNRGQRKGQQKGASSKRQQDGRNRDGQGQNQGQGQNKNRNRRPANKNRPQNNNQEAGPASENSQQKSSSRKRSDPRRNRPGGQRPRSDSRQSDSTVEKNGNVNPDYESDDNTNTGSSPAANTAPVESAQESGDQRGPEKTEQKNTAASIQAPRPVAAPAPVKTDEVVTSGPTENQAVKTLPLKQIETRQIEAKPVATKPVETKQVETGQAETKEIQSAEAETKN